jgi:hypothetical protein
MGPSGQKEHQFFVNSRLAYSAKNFEKCGGFLFRKHKVVVFGKFNTKSGGFMLLTRCNWMPKVHWTLILGSGQVIYHRSRNKVYAN